MSLRSSLTHRLAIAAAVGTLTVATMATPAIADDDWSGEGGQTSGNDGNWSQNGNGYGDTSTTNTNSNSNSNSNSNQRLSRGRVTASTLALRARPDRGGQIIRYAHRGEIVSIFCKTGGEKVDGNRLWYLLTDGTWAWGAARYIDTIGSAPRWC
ncbi:SH3 domain-containing protein [Streptomyces sp. NPDC050997]|uniref:SH3 domain-containing protein n=1 Tax=Streptomyces sp. NPDC050997 TaxID=3155519 RepID=UPI0034229A6E